MVAGRPYTAEVRRWVAVGLGCVTALGMQSLFDMLSNGLQLAGPLLPYAALVLALLLGGYVAGHLARRLPVLYAALVAVFYILLTAGLQTMREAAVARQFGLAALAPIDFVQLTLTDVLAMSGATLGGWLAARL